MGACGLAAGRRGSGASERVFACWYRMRARARDAVVYATLLGSLGRLARLSQLSLELLDAKILPDDLLRALLELRGDSEKRREEKHGAEDGW